MAVSAGGVIMPRESLPSGSALGGSMPSPGKARAAPAAPSTPRPPRDRNWRRVHIGSHPSCAEVAALACAACGFAGDAKPQAAKGGSLLPTTLLRDDAIVLFRQVIVLVHELLLHLLL